MSIISVLINRNSLLLSHGLNPHRLSGISRCNYFPLLLHFQILKTHFIDTNILQPLSQKQTLTAANSITSQAPYQFGGVQTYYFSLSLMNKLNKTGLQF